VPYGADDLYEAAAGDKKRAGDSITLVLLEGLGRAALRQMAMPLLRRFIQSALN